MARRDAKPPERSCTSVLRTGTLLAPTPTKPPPPTLPTTPDPSTAPTTPPTLPTTLQTTMTGPTTMT
eukprot:782505-Heterocapsa_arctica.AAC.1